MVPRIFWPLYSNETISPRLKSAMARKCFALRNRRNLSTIMAWSWTNCSSFNCKRLSLITDGMVCTFMFLFK